MAYLTYGELKREVILLSANFIDDIRAGEFVKTVLNRLVESYSWSSLKGHAVLATVPTKQTGTVSLTDSMTITGTGTAFDVGDIGSEIRISTQMGYYRIAGVAGQVLTLASPYAGDSFTSSAYVVFKRIYPLASDFRKMLSIPFNRKLREVTIPNLDRLDPERTYFSSNPLRFAYQGVTSAGVTQVELHPVPSTCVGFPYTYLKRFVITNSTVNGTVVPLRSDMLTNLAAADACATKAVELADQSPNTARMLENLSKRREAKGQEALAEAQFSDLAVAGALQAVRDEDQMWVGADIEIRHDVGGF